ncbi:MAG: alpha/beta hydrolase, partial [Solirubrobacterales bacterium]|nr:alpha/beta hydrolase [Solirubrobacterales bacterium]
PGGRLKYPPHERDAAERGLRLVGYDRPGYGGSSPNPGRTVADVAADVAAILDHLGAERFATWGASGGGPHALACAALLPDRCAAAATLCGAGPADAPTLDFLAGMGEENVEEFSAAQAGREALEPMLAAWRDEMASGSVEQLADSMDTVLSPVDRAALTDDLAAHLVASMQSALEPGVEGWIEDDLAFVAPWGFDVGAIAVPVGVWQGEQDLMVPPAHGHWLAANVPGAEAHVHPEDGHLTITQRRVPDVHTWLARYTF